MHTILILPEIIFKCVPTLPKIFRSVTRNTLFFGTIEQSDIKVYILGRNDRT